MALTAIKGEPLREVLQNYDLNVTGIRNETYKEKKGVWWIETTSGLKVLKKVSGSESTLRFTISAVRHLVKNGINIPHINKTKSGEDYVNMDGACFMLLDAVKGKNPSYDSKDLETIVKGLAEFHRASRGFFPPGGCKPKCHLGTWIDDYRLRVEELNGFYKNELAKRDPGVIGKTITEEFPYFYSMALNVVEALRGPEYKNWVSRAEKEG